MANENICHLSQLVFPYICSFTNGLDYCYELLTCLLIYLMTWLSQQTLNLLTGNSNDSAVCLLVVRGTRFSEVMRRFPNLAHFAFPILILSLRLYFIACFILVTSLTNWPVYSPWYITSTLQQYTTPHHHGTPRLHHYNTQILNHSGSTIQYPYNNTLRYITKALHLTTLHHPHTLYLTSLQHYITITTSPVLYLTDI